MRSSCTVSYTHLTKVYAVDVGYGQLAWSLRTDERVVNMERTNIGEVAGLDPQPDLASVDLSYLSLKKAVPIFAGICKTGADLICLVKPLFEVDDMQARRSGVLPADPETYRALLTELGEALIAQGQMCIRDRFWAFRPTRSSCPSLS